MTAPVVLDAGQYAVHLPGYDGPLALLLQLIRRDEMDIFDIPIAQLTAAYLETLSGMQALGIEPASEFLVMAATLLQIKSRMLLPKPPRADEIAGDVEDPRADLARQLFEYQRFREVAVALDERPMVGRDVFVRPMDLERPEETEAPLANLDALRLAQAFRDALRRGGYQPPHEIYVERITIAERIAQIGHRLQSEGKASFAALCADSRHREEVITTFLALLEMTRLRLIQVVQGAAMGPLYIEAKVSDIETRGEEAAGMLSVGDA